ncbi:MAG: hypothetical protein ABL901_02525 [Hyphomicrobiaceae bacterium]
MNDLHKALADIGSIRLQLASGTMFRGFGPQVVAATGLLALAMVAAQVAWLGTSDPVVLLGWWIGLAVVSTVLIGLEMVARTRRHHGGLGDAMLFHAVEHFCPVGVAGAVIGAIVLRCAPETAWMLPGLWQILVGLGLFAAIRFLPRTVAIAGAWYFAAGSVVLVLDSQTHALSPLTMGLPFVIGQLLLATILRVALGEDDAQAL